MLILCRQASVPHVDEFDIEVPQPKAEVLDPIVGRLPSEGNRRPRFQNGKPFCFVALPSVDHNFKMESSKSIDCTILKLLRVHVLGYGVIFTVVTPRSILKKEPYEITISNFPTCSCRGFGTCVHLLLEIPRRSGFFVSIFTSFCKIVCLAHLLMFSFIVMVGLQTRCGFSWRE